MTRSTLKNAIPSAISVRYRVVEAPLAPTERSVVTQSATQTRVSFILGSSTSHLANEIKKRKEYDPEQVHHVPVDGSSLKHAQMAFT